MKVLDKKYRDFTDWICKTSVIGMFTAKQHREKIVYLIENCGAFAADEVQTIKKLKEMVR